MLSNIFPDSELAISEIEHLLWLDTSWNFREESNQKQRLDDRKKLCQQTKDNVTLHVAEWNNVVQ